jgi:hypothetical protein
MPFEERPAGDRRRSVALVVYLTLALTLAGFAAYMGFIERRPLDSPYVIAPAVGAVWFALRAFMQFGVRGI